LIKALLQISLAVLGMQQGASLLLIVFAIALLLTILIYLLGGKYSAKGRKSEDKLSPYSCGEDLPYEGELRVNLERFFIYAVYFLIFDVIAFTLVISFKISPIHAVSYALITLISLIFMIKR